MTATWMWCPAIRLATGRQSLTPYLGPGPREMANWFHKYIWSILHLADSV